MTPTDKKIKLVKIYFYVCDHYDTEWKYLCERFSNNNKPEFSDQEAITIYLYAMHLEYRLKVNHIHEFASEHLRDWFPKLPSYVAFTNRINRLCEVFRVLSETVLTDFIPDDCNQDISLIDSMPVIICSGKRISKVVKEITDKGFCSTKGIYYHGLKLHGLGFYRKGHLPHPEQLLFTKASENDITHLKRVATYIDNRTYFGDKIYGNVDFWAEMEQTNNSRMLTRLIINYQWLIMKENAVREKSFLFAVRIVKLYKYLVDDKKEFVLSKQILRSGTSVGALVRESEHAESHVDFIHRMAIAQKEINETIYWLELLIKTDYLKQDQFESLNQDALEIIKLITSIIKTSKNNKMING